MSDCSSKLTVKTIPHTHTVAQIPDFNNGVNNVLNSTVLHSHSANWDSVYSTVSSNSAIWAAGNNTVIEQNSACWNKGCDVYTSYNGVSATNANINVVVQNNSALWAIDTTGDLTLIQSTSANWQSNYSTVQSNSANWLSVLSANGLFVNVTGDVMIGGLSAPSLSTGNLFVGASTIHFVENNVVIETLKSSDVSNFKTNYTTINSNSANWTIGFNQSNTLASASATNANINSTVQSNSALWAQTTDISLVASTSANWNRNYTTTNSNSANWNVGYVQSNILAGISANNISNYTTVNTNSASWSSSHIVRSNIRPEISTITITEQAEQYFLYESYIDLVNDGITYRVWFDLEDGGGGVPPANPGVLIQVPAWEALGGHGSDYAGLIATAIDSSPAFSATTPGTPFQTTATVTVTNVTVGAVTDISAVNPLGGLAVAVVQQGGSGNELLPALDGIYLTNLSATAITGIIPNTNTTATSVNTASAIVARDINGNFTAGTITANAAIISTIALSSTIGVAEKSTKLSLINNSTQATASNPRYSPMFTMQGTQFRNSLGYAQTAAIDIYALPIESATNQSIVSFAIDANYGDTGRSNILNFIDRNGASTDITANRAINVQSLGGSISLATSTTSSVSAVNRLTVSSNGTVTMSGDVAFAGVMRSLPAGVAGLYYTCGHTNTGMGSDGALAFYYQGNKVGHFTGSAGSGILRIYASTQGSPAILEAYSGAYNPWTLTSPANAQVNGVLEQRQSTNAQTFRVYNTYTSDTNHERAKIEWSGNILNIGTEKNGSGSSRPMALVTNALTAVLIGSDQTVSVTCSSVSALVVGANGSINPAFQIDTSIGSSATGLKITSAASGAGVQLDAIGGTNELLLIQSKGTGEVIFNAPSTNIRFRINSSTKMLLTDYAFTHTPIANAGAALVRYGFTGASDLSLTASTEAPSVYFNMGQTRQHAAGALTLQRDMRITGSTHSFVTSATITDATTFAVDGPPIAGTNATITNAHGIYVPSRTLTGTITNAYGINIAAPTGATNNYAAKFTGNVDTTGISKANIFQGISGVPLYTGGGAFLAEFNNPITLNYGVVISPNDGASGTKAASARLDIQSTTQGVLLPRMTKTQRDAISSPAIGLMVYQTDNTPGLRVYNGTNWMRFTETAD